MSLSADGNTAIIGGPGDNNYAGAAWVWTRSGGVWTQQGPKLIGSGAVVNPVSQGPYQGQSVALSADGNTAIIGGNGDNNGLPGGVIGAAWVWTRSGGVWTQQGTKLAGPGGGSQGSSVSLSPDGNRAIVGGEVSQGVAGAWVWMRSGSIWTQQGIRLVGSDSVRGSTPSVSVSLSADGNTIIVGGGTDQPNGAAWVFAATAPTVSVSGRILTPDGRGLRNAVVSLIDSQGVRRNATTSSFGLYSFIDVRAGDMYTLTVTTKRYRFTPRQMLINDNLSNVDFVGLE